MDMPGGYAALPRLSSSVLASHVRYDGAMSYREPQRPQVPPEVAQAQAELVAMEAQMMKAARRKRTIFALAVTGVCVVCLGTCVGPLGYGIARDAWDDRKTKLTKDEQKQVETKLSAIEANVKKSQEAFEAAWPKIRSNEIGARADLGRCGVYVPGPSLETKDDSLSLGDSSASSGWTFVDLTPADKRSPIGTLKMPRGSIPTSNGYNSERFVLPPSPLRTAQPEKAPILDARGDADRAAELRKESLAPIRHDLHGDFLQRVDEFVNRTLPVEVIVFLDVWEDPGFTAEVAKPEPKRNQRDEAWGFQPKDALPVRVFKSGIAIARAFAWDPSKQTVACASQGLAINSEDITFRSSDISPLQQDLVLQLERRLQKSFVAVGTAPPKIERP
jgi:hypothetical protein